MSKAIKIERITNKPLSKRNFLPEVNQLEPEQVNVVSQPSSADILVSGPAGSGKTILAAYRYDDYKKKGSNGKVLVYGNVLKNYLGEKVGTSTIKLVPRGIFEYVKSVSGITIKNDLPDSQKYEDASQRAGVWAEQYKERLDFIVIDESQDFHNGHLDFCGYLAKYLTLFADDAQKLYKHGNCTTNILGKYWVEHNRKIKRIDIKGNYRNQPPIANIASPFYHKRNQEPFSSAKLEGEEEKVTIFVGKNLDSFQKVLIQQTKYYVDRIINESPKIGILVQDNQSMRIASNYFEQEKYNCIEVDNAANIFNSNNPVILTMHAAKGLEFDYVILFNLDYNELKGKHPDNFDQILFTAITRARRSLSILIIADQNVFLDKIKREVSNKYYEIRNI
jgi:superfamily I DNA/RNA helicase